MGSLAPPFSSPALHYCELYIKPQGRIDGRRLLSARNGILPEIPWSRPVWLVDRKDGRRSQAAGGSGPGNLKITQVKVSSCIFYGRRPGAG
jgi:hypothetical protein